MTPRRTIPIMLWRGRVEQGLVRAIISPSRPVADVGIWEHPLPEDKWLRLQQVRRANLGKLTFQQRKHCWW